MRSERAAPRDRGTGSVIRGASAAEADARIRDELPDFSGQVLVAACGSAILHAPYGLADRETGRPVTLDTVFDIGSLTKQFTAAAVVLLAARGALTTDDPVGRFLADLPPDKARIALHHLLTHTAGLPLYSGDDYAPMTAEGLVKWFATVPLESAPGVRYSYSNPGYSLLALVVEQASCLPYEAFLHHELLRPAGLVRTGYRVPQWAPGDVAVGYTEGTERFGTPLEHAWANDGPWWNLRGNGGILSAAGELFQWTQALKEEKILPASSVGRLTTPRVEAGASGQWYGYGWKVVEDNQGRRFVGHSGGNDSFFADVRWYESRDLTIVVTCNAFRLEMIRSLFRTLGRIDS